MFQKYLAAVEAVSFSTVRNQARVPLLYSRRTEKRNPYWSPRFTPESSEEPPFFLSSHPSKNLTTNHQDAFNSPTNSGEEPFFKGWRSKVFTTSSYFRGASAVAARGAGAESPDDRWGG